MRIAGLLLVAACGGGAVDTRIAPMEPIPDHLAEHQHGPPAHPDDASTLYVEITSHGDHGDILRQGATAGLRTVPHTVEADVGGDVELHVEMASLTPAACKVKIFVLRLPQHDLLAIADGGASVTDTTADACLTVTGTAIVRERLPVLLQRQLDAKR
jgi:hypothetical protein